MSHGASGRRETQQGTDTRDGARLEKVVPGGTGANPLGRYRLPVGFIRGTTVKERLRDNLSEVGESFEYLRSDIKNLGRYMAEMEELIEHYRTFAETVTLSTPADRAALRKLLKKTLKVVGAAPARYPKSSDIAHSETREREQIVLASGPKIP